jgi:predicted nucleic acid-binding protein
MAAATLLNPSSEDFSQGMTTVRALRDQPITLIDATLAAVAARMKMSVWTYDHHFDAMRIPVWR